MELVSQPTSNALAKRSVPPDMAPLSVDVAVVGAGPTGAMAALGAAEAGFRVALIAPEPAHDPRTTALLMPSVDFLTTLGVWPLVEDKAAPLATMRIIDATDRIPRAPEIAFDANEVELDQFGFNIMNDDLNAGLAMRLAQANVIRVVGTATAFREGAPASVELENGRVDARLVVAADGSQSVIRQTAGIAVREWDYDQTAFVTTLSHDQPHGDASTEFHTDAGPFTLVPLPGDRSSLVWVCRPEEAERYHAMDPGPLARAVEARASYILGRMRVDGPRGLIPMKGMIATRFGEGCVVLVGEAAHRFPPIGAQGLNLGVRDARVFTECLGSHDDGASLAGVAERYDRRRRVDVGARTAAVDLLNRSLLADFAPVTVMRTVALAAARGSSAIRRMLMSAGLGSGRLR